MENKVIDGKLIYLTSITYDDCEDFVRWRNSDFVNTRFIYRKPITIVDENNWIKNKVETGEVVQFIVWNKADGKKIGCTYLLSIDKNNKKCEYGMFIGEKEYSGGGRGTEAAILTSEFAFESMGMHKIYLRVLEDNIASYRACEKAGFSKEGMAIDDVWINGEPRNVIFMSKIKGENK